MRKNEDGNVFQNLIRTIDNLLGKKSIIYFENNPNILSCTSLFLHKKKDLKDSNTSYNLYFC